jgi:hypothetical protein
MGVADGSQLVAPDIGAFTPFARPKACHLYVQRLENVRRAKRMPPYIHGMHFANRTLAATSASIAPAVANCKRPV